jgi:membrane associated rhomboid family serine protease
MTSTPPVENRCYRHPDRESFVRCQRCGRTICGECQTIAPVGVHCPECVRESRASAPSGPSFARRLGRVAGPNSSVPIVTYSIMAICLVIYAIQFLTGDLVTGALIYAPSLTAVQPYRMITSIFIHESILHVALNMYSLWLFGPALESMMGRIRYLALFLIAGFGGSVGVLLLAPHNEAVLGASGAIFGVFAAFFILARRLGGNSGAILGVIVINLVIGFIPGFGIAWQAHLGGLIVGAGLALVYLKIRRRSLRWLEVVLTAAIAAVLVAITAVAVALG